MAERTQAEKPNNFNPSASGAQPRPKMAEAPNWDNSNDFNTPRRRRVMPLAAAGAGPQALMRVRSSSRLDRNQPAASAHFGRTNPSRKRVQIQRPAAAA